MAALLLDTHTLLWFGSDDPKLPQSTRLMVEDQTAEVFVSAATAWEIATKFRLGKLPSAAGLAGDLAGALLRYGFLPLAVSIEHGQKAGELLGDHKDPFDRMLAAQAIVEGHSLISNDTAFDAFGVKRLW